MENKLQKLLENCFPHALKKTECTKRDFTPYQELNQLADYAVDGLTQKKTGEVKEVFEMMDKLYQFGNLYDRNSIENEFLFPITQCEKEGLLKEHLKLMPKSMKAVYLKIILEN